MSDQFVIHLVREAFYNVLLIVGPLLIVSLIVGLVISIFQAATSISEQTLTFVPKILSVIILVVILLPFILSTLKTFVIEVYSWIPKL